MENAWKAAMHTRSLSFMEMALSGRVASSPARVCVVLIVNHYAGLFSLTPVLKKGTKLTLNLNPAGEDFPIELIPYYELYQPSS